MPVLIQEAPRLQDVVEDVIPILAILMELQIVLPMSMKALPVATILPVRLQFLSLYQSHPLLHVLSQ